MRLVIRHTILLQLLLGLTGFAEDPPTQPTHYATVDRQGRVIVKEGPIPQELKIVQARIPTLEKAIVTEMLIDPLTGKRVKLATGLVTDVLSRKFDSPDQAKGVFSAAVDEVSKLMPPGKELSGERRQEIVEALVDISQQNNNDEAKVGLEKISDKLRQAEEKVKVQEENQKLADEVTKLKENTDKEKEEAAKKAQAEKQKEAQAQKQKEAEAFEKQLEQQALAQALNQAANGGGNGRGAGQGGSGSNGNSGNNKPSESSKSDNNQIRHDNLADQLSKALNQNNNNQNLSSLFGNNNSSSSNSSNKEKKEDPFKLDTSPKITQNKAEPAKAATSGSDSNPLDPSTPQSGNNESANISSGPTSVPQLMAASAQNPFNPSFEGDGGGATGGGFGGGIKGGVANNFDNGSASEIFSSVGKMDYGERPPPIRKDSAAYGGEGGGGEGSGEGGFSGSNGSQKKFGNSLIDELTLMSNNPRAKGRGIMAFVGYQVRDFCSKAGSKKLGVCNNKTKSKSEKVSFYQ